MEQQEALEQIKLIRDTMQKATQKFFFSPWQWIEWGIVVIVGGLLTHWLLAAGDTRHILTIWLSVFIIGSALEGVAWILDAQRRGIDLFSPFVLKVWGVFGCFLAPGFIMTPVLIQLDLTAHLIGFWLLMTGSAMFMLVLLGDRKDILWMGLLLFISGILSVSIFLDYALHIAVAGFGVGGLLFGIYLLVKEKRNQKSEA